MNSEIDIRPAVSGDLPTAIAWLQGAGLPTADLSSRHMLNFLFAYRGEWPIGMVGVEAYADCGLLRSLYVSEDSRSTGAGSQLTTALEAKALGSGMTSLWLLTIDADGFFARHGYSVMRRDSAPESIQATAEFTTLCPGDAVLMRKRLQMP